MSDVGEQAMATARAFIDAFNAQDHERLAGTLNYPHVRLAKGAFETIATHEDCVARSHQVAPALAEEGWDHTVVAAMEVVHEGPGKVHLAITNHRCHADGTVYKPFDTLWVVTLQDGHWGVQFRSSYLR
ncbi:MAG: hypothetical protein OXI03_11020 [Chloroflexota bacterium]|nr:hypothetical protein [Chloroflexota bacterium]